MISSAKFETYGLQKDEYISISIEIPEIVTKKSNKNLSRVVQEVVAKEAPQDVNVEDLFNDVWTKDIKKVKPKPKNSKRISEINKQIKTSKDNSVESFSEKISNIDANEVSDTNTPTSTGSEVNEYFAKIQALVYKHFNPPENSQGYSVKAVIELSAIGKVIDFRILSYSTNQGLNDECDNIKSRLSSVLFPINPKNESGNYTVILTSKE
jgi:protein TonB